jgi:hypothetical protein
MELKKTRLLFGLTFIAIIIFGLLAGCGKKEGQKGKQSGVSHRQGAEEGKPLEVELGPSQGKWKTVKLGITDKKLNRDLIVPIDIGTTVSIPETGLSIKLNYFLPDFMVKGAKATTVSNELKNPAVSLSITDKDTKDPSTGNVLTLNGLLFSRFHNDAMNHPRYNFVLVEFIPVAAK